jgi:hypothetical protein
MRDTRIRAGQTQLQWFTDTAETRFLVYNVTDGVMAWPELMTLAEARRFVQHFPERFARQGCYLTASWERISPDAVLLEIVDSETGLGLGIASASESSHGGGENE